jgi:hypothetical protein
LFFLSDKQVTFGPNVVVWLSYGRLKPHVLDENEASVFKLRLTIGSDFEKSRGGLSEKNIHPTR